MPTELRRLLLDAVDNSRRSPLDHSYGLELVAVALIADAAAHGVLQAHLTAMVIACLEHAIEERMYEIEERKHDE